MDLHHMITPNAKWSHFPPKVSIDISVWRYDLDAAAAGLFNRFASYMFPSKGELFDKQDKQTSDEDRPIVETM
jgi:hypothetical protein